ncbi:MAG: PEP-CTERM sorting domain-containing protein, partial [Verrucomicrobiota bacterium]
ILLGATCSALAVVNFTETFSTDDSDWLNGASGTPTYNATGGVDNSGYISYSVPDFNSGVGPFPGSDPLALFFRGNATNDASGDAFVGNWITSGVETFSVAVRHNYSTSLNFYARIASFGGAGASSANNALYEVAPNTWTTITFPITDTNPPFASYGSSSFAGVFSNIQNLQLGYYLPASTEIEGLVVGLDNVSVLVPEPQTYSLMFGLMVLGLVALRRRTSKMA